MQIIIGTVTCSLRVRQEVLNVHLAELLSELGLHATAERRGYAGKVPDLVLRHPLLGIVLGEAEIGDTWSDMGARERLRKRAHDRFSHPSFKFVDFILLVIYPRDLAEESASLTESEIVSKLKQSRVGVGLAYRAPPNGIAEPKIIWHAEPVHPTELPGILETLMQSALREVLGAVFSPEDVVERIIELIEKTSAYAKSLARSDKQWLEFWEQIAKKLDIDVEILCDKSEGAYLAAKTLYTLIAITVIIYETARVRYPGVLKAIDRPINFQKLAEALDDLRRVNYLEIVDMIYSALAGIPSERTFERALDVLYELILKNRDVLVRAGWEALALIYQKLLSETYRKAYATFYTKMPAALLLASLATEGPDERVIDPAEGTGSLLVASFYIRQWLSLKPSYIANMLKEASKEAIVDRVSARVLDNTYGLDALRMAVALSCGSLTIASLALPHKRLKLYHVPVGSKRAGSLDLFFKEKRRTMPEEVVSSVGSFDLVIMNPPFTRSDVVPNLIGEEARKEIAELKLTFGGVDLKEIFVAGLAKPFLALADALIREQGKIAAVLPNSVLSRPTWKDLREGISRAYTVKYIVISWAPATPNFSSDTEFREILLVLRKGREDEPVRVIYLLEPIDHLNATDISAIAGAARSRRVEEGESIGVVRRKNGKDVVMAKVFEYPQSVVAKFKDNLYRLVAFFSPELAKWHISLLERFDTSLGSLFSIGSNVDHLDGLKVIKGYVSGAHPAVWGSGCEAVRGPVVEAPSHGIVIEDSARVKVKFWKAKRTFYFSKLFILRRGQIDTQCVLSFSTLEPAVSNVWWPLRPKCDGINPTVPMYVAFFNSTFGFAYMLGERLETRGTFIELKKEKLGELRVPDFGKLPGSLNEKSVDALRHDMPRFDHYIESMAKLEESLGSWRAAAERAVSLGDPLAERAALDLLVFEALDSLYPGLKPPERLYGLLHEEIRVLSNIMEGNEKEESTIKDLGRINAGRGRHEPLTKWAKKSS